MSTLIKRILDICISLPGVTILSPVFVVIAIAIKLSSKGPAIFKQERTDKNGEPPVCYKFHAMVADVDLLGPSLRFGDAPLLTKIEKWLLEYLLDEFHFCIL